MILCLDYGDRHIGIAAADVDDRIPYRYGSIDQKSVSALSDISRIVELEHVEKLLVGVPIAMSGADTEQTEKTRAFIEELKGVLPDVAVEEINEVFTSKEARRVLEAEGGKMEDEHSEAARLMLAQYLEISK